MIEGVASLAILTLVINPIPCLIVLAALITASIVFGWRGTLAAATLLSIVIWFGAGWLLDRMIAEAGDRDVDVFGLPIMAFCLILIVWIASVPLMLVSLTNPKPWPFLKR